MLFTTATFVLLYLPLTLLGFFLIGRRSPSAAAGWLFLASLFFYGYWMPQFTLLLLLSIGVNFWLGLRMLKVLSTAGAGEKTASAKRWLVAGVVFNLGLLAYFKYANFFIDNLEWLAGTEWNLPRVILPIGISFYSFTQIAFLVDTSRGKVREANFIHYGLFVTYFPHLIAGPVLHHAQMMPQFDDRSIYAPRTGHLVAGLAIFLAGLLKKVVLADGISPYADAVFQPVDAGGSPGTAEAWIAAVAYTLQLYFDFSGYSDMAIGLSWMFNVRLPFNFDSPYRATSISDFWRRWHISLSNFLRDYLYIAMGGNRHGALRRHANLLTTMLLGGLWHGASWSFVIWGGLHGAYLVINHAFRATLGQAVCAMLDRSRTWRLLAWGLTMLAVVIGWVFFRAHTLGGAMRMLEAMAGQAQAGIAGMPLFWNAGLQPSTALAWCAVLGAVATLLPNSNWLGARVLAWCETPTVLRTALGTAGLLSVLFLVVINAARDSASAFIYFNF
jgi:alginate O-acetyltransferase complex protein AlgI